MGTYNVEIGDGTGKAFKLKVVTVFMESNEEDDAYWRSIDKGYIRYNSGKLKEKQGKRDRHVFLYNKAGTWGIKLENFTGRFFANDQGVGELAQPWVLKAKPGRISWVILD